MKGVDGRVWLVDVGAESVNLLDADTLRLLTLEELVDRHNSLNDALVYLDNLHGDST